MTCRTERGRTWTISCARSVGCGAEATRRANGVARATRKSRSAWVRAKIHRRSLPLHANRYTTDVSPRATFVLRAQHQPQPARELLERLAPPPRTRFDDFERFQYPRRRRCFSLRTASASPLAAPDDAHANRSPAAFRRAPARVIRLARRGRGASHSTRVDTSSSVATTCHSRRRASKRATTRRGSTTMSRAREREVVAADPRRTSPTLRRRPRTRPRRSARDRDRSRSTWLFPFGPRTTTPRISCQGGHRRSNGGTTDSARLAARDFLTTTRRERSLRSGPTPPRRLPTPSCQPPTRRGARARRRRVRTDAECSARTECWRPRTSARRIPPSS